MAQKVDDEGATPAERASAPPPRCPPAVGARAVPTSAAPAPSRRPHRRRAPPCGALPLPAQCAPTFHSTTPAALAGADVKVLTISEVGALINDYVRNTQQRDAEYQPSAMLLKVADYSARFATNKNRETLQKMRE